jgi:hypothetical protein
MEGSGGEGKEEYEHLKVVVDNVLLANADLPGPHVLSLLCLCLYVRVLCMSSIV